MFQLSLCLYGTAAGLTWVSAICPLSINSAFSEITAYIEAKFYRKITIHHISTPFVVLNLFIIQNFMISLEFAFVNIGTYGSYGNMPN